MSKFWTIQTFPCIFMYHFVHFLDKFSLPNMCYSPTFGRNVKTSAFLVSHLAILPMNDIDDLIHYFVHCERTMKFWKCLFNWWNKYGNLLINCKDILFKVYILFGFIIINDDFIALNYVILLAKKIIHTNNCKNNMVLDIYEFQMKLKYYLILETNTKARTSLKALLEYLE